MTRTLKSVIHDQNCNKYQWFMIQRFMTRILKSVIHDQYCYKSEIHDQNCHKYQWFMTQDPSKQASICC